MRQLDGCHGDNHAIRGSGRGCNKVRGIPAKARTRLILSHRCDFQLTSRKLRDYLAPGAGHPDCRGRSLPSQERPWLRSVPSPRRPRLLSPTPHVLTSFSCVPLVGRRGFALRWTRAVEQNLLTFDRHEPVAHPLQEAHDYILLRFLKAQATHAFGCHLV